MGALIGIGALIDKNTFEWGVLIRNGALIGRRALNRISISGNYFALPPIFMIDKAT